mmetsp:Transcript_28355/g.25064  ORF Transcript_28355/g.25064 Transcript_28355/m.25064 type:complete len:104 (+) Transcript_28355:628-939(+)
MLHPENAIAIKSWYQDINDKELLKLIPVLIKLSNVEDVRDHIKDIKNLVKTKVLISKSSNILPLPRTVKHQSSKLDKLGLEPRRKTALHSLAFKDNHHTKYQK